MTDLNNNVAIVTGAAGGDGGDAAIYCRDDVTPGAEVGTLVADTLARLDTIDVLVNNAGIFVDPAKKLFTEIDAAEWDRVVSVILRGVFASAKAVAPAMI